jgi:hypothetical protein
VYFPDIPPSVWDQMMKYLDRTKYLNVFEAASLREWYIRYGFEEGKRVCDRALYWANRSLLSLEAASSLWSMNHDDTICCRWCCCLCLPAYGWKEKSTLQQHVSTITYRVLLLLEILLHTFVAPDMISFRCRMTCI